MPDGPERSLLTTNKADSESGNALCSSTFISSPETTVNGKPVIDLFDVPVSEFLKEFTARV
jgi:hypothetical protein